METLNLIHPVAEVEARYQGKLSHEDPRAKVPEPWRMDFMNGTQRAGTCIGIVFLDKSCFSFT
jgi:hypothetical protein